MTFNTEKGSENMAFYFDEPSHTFSEYLLIPGYTSEECIPANVSLRTPLVKFKKGEKSAIEMSIPLVSAIMQSFQTTLWLLLWPKKAAMTFIYSALQSIEDEAAMVARVKSYKAGFCCKRLKSHSRQYSCGCD